MGTNHWERTDDQNKGTRSRFHARVDVETLASVRKLNCR